MYPITNAGQGQGQYYAATNSGATAVTGTVGYTTGGQYVVQHAVDAEPIIASQRVSPQTTNAVRKITIFLKINSILCSTNIIEILTLFNLELIYIFCSRRLKICFKLYRKVYGVHYKSADVCDFKTLYLSTTLNHFC